MKSKNSSQALQCHLAEVSKANTDRSVVVFDDEEEAAFNLDNDVGLLAKREVFEYAANQGRNDFYSKILFHSSSLITLVIEDMKKRGN